MSQDDTRWRPATPDDATQIAELELELFGDTAWPEPVVREELAGPHRSYTVIEQNGRILGYGGVLVVQGDGDIQTIAVTPEVRGTGLGRALLDHLLNETRRLGARQVFLEVRADNPVAIGLYERTGFEHIAVRRGYYQPGNIDAMIMRLDLRSEEGRE